MKKLLAILLILGMCSLTYAGTVTVTSGDNYVPGQEKIVRVQMPEHVWVTSLNAGGVTVAGGTLVSITETFPNKTMDTNGTKFVIYSMDSTVMEGDNLLFTVLPDGNGQVMLNVVGIKAADPNADPVVVEDFTVTMYSNLDFDNDGDFDADDFTFILNQYITSNTVTFQQMVDVLHAYVNG